MRLHQMGALHRFLLTAECRLHLENTTCLRRTSIETKTASSFKENFGLATSSIHWLVYIMPCRMLDTKR